MAAAEIHDRAAPPPLKLTPEQERALQFVRDRRSVCISGPAGCGKSTLLHHIRTFADVNEIAYGVTAMTGCAALLVGGRTVHSYLAIGLATRDPESMASFTRRVLRPVYKRLNELEMLIIDEISMANGGLIDTISEYLQRVRCDARPFGGIQMVFIGDFTQLPPVVNKRGATGSNGSGASQEFSFAFEAKEWVRLAPKVVVLHQVMRQAGDTAFVDLLGRLRWGECTPEDLLALHECKTRTFDPSQRPTKLFALNADVDRVNADEYEELIKRTGAERILLTTTYGGPRKDASKRWAESCDIPEQVEVAVGAHIVVTANVNPDAGIVNGTQAVVVKWTPPMKIGGQSVGGHLTLRLKNGAIYNMGAYVAREPDSGATVMYYPIKLAYALSIHKCQGMTLDAIEVDLGSSIFVWGQAYTALSRARSLDTVRILDVKARSFRTHPKVIDFYRNTHRVAV